MLDVIFLTLQDLTICIILNQKKSLQIVFNQTGKIKAVREESDYKISNNNKIAIINATGLIRDDVHVFNTQCALKFIETDVPFID